tara:strand:- start:5218 stop:5535 length:318 start_codon:yes stop_codon:yes gene_type:complete
MSKNKRASTRRKTTYKRIANKKPVMKKNYHAVRGKDCTLKVLYKTREEAFAGLRIMLSQNGDVFSSLNVYKCPKIHDGFHIGHNMKLTNETIMNREKKFANINIL